MVHENTGRHQWHNALSLESPVMITERMRSVGAFPWLGSVLYDSSALWPWWLGGRKGTWPL